MLYGIDYEYAVTAIDLLARRTRLAFLDAASALQALPRVLELLAQKLDWPQHRIEKEKQQALQLSKKHRLLNLLVDMD